jgi:excisionase family DNA binding protein
MTLDHIVREMLRDTIREEIRAALRDFRQELALLPAKHADDDPYLTVTEAADVAGVAPETVRAWVRRGDLAAGRAGRLVRIRTSVLHAYLERPTEPVDELTESDLDRLTADLLASEKTRCSTCGHVQKLHSEGRRCRVKKCGCQSWA